MLFTNSIIQEFLKSLIQTQISKYKRKNVKTNCKNAEIIGKIKWKKS